MEGSLYCSLCVCIVAACPSPRHHGSLCWGHGKVLGQLPLAVRLTRAARPWLVSLIPCDVIDFLRRFSRLRHNVPLLVMSALLKEPKAVSGMLERLPNLDQVTAESLQAALIGMLQALKSEEHTKQTEQLNRQGVARFLGSTSTCRIWGVIRTSDADRPTGQQSAAQKTSTKPTGKQSAAQKTSTKPTGKQSAAQKTSTKPTGKQSAQKTGRPTGKQGAPEETPRGHKRKAIAVAATHGNAEVVHLGVSSREYQATNDCSQLAKLIEVTRTHSWPSTVVNCVASFRLCVARVKVLDEAMSEACTAWGRDTVGYGHSFLRRKLILGELCSTPVSERGVNWGDVSLEDLKMCSPDQNQLMDTFPAKWSAKDVSLFCFGRSDWAIFVPLFGCLFGEVVKKTEAEPDALVKLVESEAFGEAAKAHHEQYGIASHPYALVRGFGKPEYWPIA